jgi:polar amino acid transport system permease protein
MTGVTPPAAILDVRKPHRSHWEYVGWVAATTCAALLLFSVVTNPNFHWEIVGEYLTAPIILRGIGMTLMLTAISVVVGVLFGAVLAVMMRSPSKVLARLATGYVWFFRGTPLLVQLIFWFNLAALYPTIGFGDFQINATHLITPFMAAVIGLTTNEAAYMAEIIRGGFLAVDAGQRDAARAIGMHNGLLMRKVVIPQAARIIVPAAVNQYILLLKSTSLASAIGYLELLRITTDIYAANFRVVELLAVAGFWYLVMTAFATALQTALEKLYPHR